MRHDLRMKRQEAIDGMNRALLMVRPGTLPRWLLSFLAVPLIFALVLGQALVAVFVMFKLWIALLWQMVMVPIACVWFIIDVAGITVWFVSLVVDRRAPISGGKP